MPPPRSRNAPGPSWWSITAAIPAIWTPSRHWPGKHGLKIIEDCAHAPGAVYHADQGPRLAGTLGDAGCFSFFANKNLTTGEGGMVVTDDEDLAGQIKTARSHGMTTLTWDRHRGHSFSYDVVARGYNYRLDELRAALGMVQLHKLTSANARRRELTEAYRARLQDLDRLEIPFRDAPAGSAHHLFPILLREPSQRADFMAALAREGIQTSIHYPPVHLFSYYQSLWDRSIITACPRRRRWPPGWSPCPSTRP